MIGIHRIFHPTSGEYEFFQSEHGMVAKLDHILGHKIMLNKFQKVEVLHSTFSIMYYAIKLDIHYK